MALKRFLAKKDQKTMLEKNVYEKNLSPDFYKDPVKNDVLTEKQISPEDKYKEPEYEPLEKARLKRTGHAGDVPGNPDEF